MDTDADVLMQVKIPMLLLNAMDDPIVPPELLYIPRQFACMSPILSYSAASNHSMSAVAD